MMYGEILNIPVSPPLTIVPIKLFLASMSTESHEQGLCALCKLLQTSLVSPTQVQWMASRPLWPLRKHHRALLPRNFTGQ